MMNTRSLRKTLKVVVAVSFALLMSSPLYATGVGIDGKWNEFSFGNVGVFAKGCQPGDPSTSCVLGPATTTQPVGPTPWTFTAPAAGALLTVTDAFTAGDIFRVYDFGGSPGITSTVATNTSADCGADPDACFADARFSHGVFLLAAGNHSIKFKPVKSPYGGGAAFFRVESAPQPAPEPATLFLVGTGLAALGLRRRRQA